MENISNDKKKNLLEKRKALKCKIVQEQQLNLIIDIREVLDAQKIEYKIIFDKDDNSALIRNWVSDNFEIADWGRINWLDINRPIKWSMCDPGLKNKIIEALDKMADKSASLYVLWSSAERPILNLKLDDFKSYLLEIFEEDFDTWVFCPDSDWCLEFYHEGDVVLGVKAG